MGTTARIPTDLSKRLRDEAPHHYIGRNPSFCTALLREAAIRACFTHAAARRGKGHA